MTSFIVTPSSGYIYSILITFIFILRSCLTLWLISDIFHCFKYWSFLFMFTFTFPMSIDFLYVCNIKNIFNRTLKFSFPFTFLMMIQAQLNSKTVKQSTRQWKWEDIFRVKERWCSLLMILLSLIAFSGVKSEINSTNKGFKSSWIS